MIVLHAGHRYIECVQKRGRTSSVVSLCLWCLIYSSILTRLDYLAVAWIVALHETFLCHVVASPSDNPRNDGNPI